MTECNARRRAYRGGADRWRWGPQDERPRAVRSAEEDRCGESRRVPRSAWAGNGKGSDPAPIWYMIGPTTPGGLFVEQIHALIGLTQVD